MTTDSSLKTTTSPFAGAATYKTDPGKRRCLVGKISPALAFYPRISSTVYRAARIAKAGLYDGDAWIKSSLEVFNAVERSGGNVLIEGMENLPTDGKPVVYVANHMSTLETFLLPSILRPRGPVTFVIKEQLLNYPVFGWVMRSRNPIAVGRANPREDLTTVLREGKARLTDGMSVIVFPQTTRAPYFDPSAFNSIGAKLAARSEVKLIPLALKTNFWSTGKRFKDFGPILPANTVHFKFGVPLEPEGKGDAAHRATVKFITEELARWGASPPEPVEPSAPEKE
ncbi:MAG: 1-acyl-sn-glycerol-3-phosphate acyltransferase [Deltaproteobacteria bacterium]|nr:MAG: 1-acyl-sn-glycerol-3-phosphate acyltransferase [Deltaproteobacteria bacterium]